MATSKPTTKAKTKTSKKKPAVKAAAKTTKKSVATKAKKTTAKKPAVKVAAKATKPVVTTGKLAFLKRPQVVHGVILAAVAALAGVLINTFSAQVLLGHLAKDELASRAGTVLAPAAHVLYDVEIRWLLVVLLAFGAVFAVLRGTRLKAKDEAGLAARVQPLRWIDVAVTGALSFEIVALLNGLQDAVALKLAMVSILLAAYFAWIYEREQAATGKPSRAILIASQVTTWIPILVLATTMLGSYVYGVVRSPWYAYAAAVVLTIGLAATPRNLKKLTGIGKSGYAAFDKLLNTQSLILKVVFAAVLIIGLYSK